MVTQTGENMKSARPWKFLDKFFWLVNINKITRVND